MSLFYSILLLTFPVTAQAEFALKSDSAGWKSLLQYQKSVLGFESSEVDGASFFLSSSGKTDPQAELDQTLAAFALPPVWDDKGESNSHALCRFPARSAYLKAHLPKLPLWKSLPEVKCAAYMNYRERIQNRKVSLVFTSYYSGSASSIFGHSFLKFSGDNENELFDTGINFAATPTTSNAVLYALYGLVGVFPSSFSAQPFYTKVREYNDFESRDLWLYELNLSQDQKERLIDHLWELGNTHFDYFYFNENCSYQILRAIEGALPEFRFFERRPVYLIPSESIRLVSETPGLIKQVRYRPSLQKVADTGFQRLRDEQKAEVLKDLKNPALISDDPEVVDVLIDAIDIKQDSSNHSWKESVLVKRASMSAHYERPEVPVPLDERPDLGHGSRRLLFGLDSRSSNHESMNTYRLSARASHHDLLDPSVGYPRHLHIDFGRVGFRFIPTSKRLIVDELTLVDLTALAPVQALQSKWSYAVKIGFERYWNPYCSDEWDCSRFSMKGGIGKSIYFPQKLTAFGFMNFEPEYSSALNRSKFKFNVEPSLGLIWEWNLRLKSRLESGSRYDFSENDPWNFSIKSGHRWVMSQSLGLNLEGAREWRGVNSSTRVGMHVLYYF